MRIAPIMLAAGLLAMGAPLQGQGAPVRSCPGHRLPVADLGIEHWSCDCTFEVSSEGATQRWYFRGEPTLLDIRPGGPSDGKLRDGDVLVAVNGLLITTREAGLRLATLKPGEAVRLTIRRNGQERQVTIVPGSRCPPEAPVAPEAPAVTIVRPAPAAAVATPAPPARVSVAAAPQPAPPAPAAVAAPAPPEAPRPWFGFGITCSHCEILGGNHWRFSSYPEIYSVDPGSPADRAGLHKGDELIAIDGLSLLKSEGAARFDALEPGETVRWTYRRNGRTDTVRITAESAPGFHVFTVQPDRIAQHEVALALTDSIVQRLRGTSIHLAEVTREQREAMARAVQAELAAAQARTVVGQAAPVPSAPSRLRYTGSLGNVDVDVRGPGSVEVTRDDGTGELVIRTADAVIRLKTKD